MYAMGTSSSSSSSSFQSPSPSISQMIVAVPCFAFTLMICLEKIQRIEDQRVSTILRKDKITFKNKKHVKQATPYFLSVSLLYSTLVE